ncbi:hypothetical protein LJR225_001357 [Phenylobacterium sp. LjRoot225]|uniref:hypothetical protein n=1 Tax=Phenylobacterium sp. LjRoot225 TaxID=3342285 RepID=UPI003ECDACB0
MARLKLSRYGAAAGGLVLLAFSAGAGQPRQNPDYGFVLAKMGVVFYRGDEKIDCPEGRSPSLREAFLATQTPAEQARLLKAENAAELEHKYKEDYVYGPGGKDICTNSEAFDTPDRGLQKTVQSKIGPGLDLDRAASDDRPAPGACAHKSFTSPTGEAGVDNQYFRAIACNTFWRGAATGVGDGAGELYWTSDPVVVVVRGVDSWENDPQVEVLIAASPDKPPVDTTQAITDGGSLNVTSNPRYRIVLTGRIENGVLTTDPANLVLPRSWVGASGGEFILNHARLRVRLTPQGELVGDAGGYRPIDNALAVMHVGGPGVASTAGVDCASVRKTLRVLADGDPDPKTGACTSVSTGLDFAAKPAFVFDKGVLVGAPRGPIQQAQR